jgi:dihydrofolate synthase/folylpolyglutamate synthase
LNNSIQEFLSSLVDYERVVSYNYDLEAYKEFLNAFDAPQKKLKNVILIGGTKGKGSTAAILNACLVSGGYRVGLYSSPHLCKLNERIRVNNRNIADTELENLVSRVKPLIVAKSGARSFFEALTTIAFLYFLEKQTDFTILEVGLGGRLDATNAADPLISVITRVGYDHTNLLGTTLSQITNEKAGIIRNNGELITIHQRFDAEKTIKRAVRDRSSSIIFADEQHKIDISDMSLKGSHVSITGRLGEIETFLPLAGAHQIENLALTLAVLFELKTMGFYLGLDTITKGIANTQLHGRFDVVSQTPLVIFDCAHNEDSFKALENTLRDLHIEDFHLVFGTNKDKDINYCLRNIFPKAREVYLVKSDNPRAVDPQDLLANAKRHQASVTISNSVPEAIQAASKSDAKAIIITGSFYLWQKEWKV